MNKKLLLPAIAALLSLNAAALAAEPASAGLLNDWLRGESAAFTNWDFGGQFRFRFEHKEKFAAPGRPGAVDFRRSGGDDDNTYWLTREKIHAGLSPANWFSAFAEGRNSTSAGDDRNPNPESDEFDLHQAFVRLGDASQFPLTLKAGRQELLYGDERLIGASDWGNVGRVFDAAKLRYETSDVWVDAFVSRVVMVRDNHFNEANDYDFFSGIYASTKTLIPKQETQLYFLARNVGKNSPIAIGSGLPPLLTGASPRDIYTIGLRVKSLPGEFHGWDYEAELAGQFGRFQMTAVSPSLDHEAFAAHVAGGYTWAKTWGSPRLGLEYNYASGDSDPTDNKHGTFDNIFPTNHKFYGCMDFVSWQNIHNARLATSLKPFPKLTLTADYHAFWLADARDSFYQVSGAPRNAGGYGVNPSSGSYVGSEIDCIATYSIKPYGAVQAGYGHFFVADYVKNSLADVAGAADTNFVYAQMTFNF